MLTTHIDCSMCCELGRCHWCLNKPGTVVLFDPDRQHTFRACAKHAELVQGHPRFPKIPVIGYDGTFRPAEIAVDEEAAQRARTAFGYGTTTNDTPATLR